MAVFIGGMILLGYDAGPQMVTTNLNITYTVVWSLALANVLGAGLCLVMSGSIAKLTTVRFPLLVPFLFMMITFAAFQSRQTLWDLVALIGIGLLGIFMRRFDWPRPAFLIGFVLASQAEVYTYQAFQIAGSKFAREASEGLSYIFSPIVIVLAIITVVSVWLGARQSAAIRPPETSHEWNKTPAVWFTVLVALFLVASLVDSLMVSVTIDKVFPAGVACIAIFSMALLLIKMRRSAATSNIFYDVEVGGEEAEAPHGLWKTLAWFLSLLVLTGLFGFIIAITTFFISFLRVRGGASWLRTLILTVCGVGFLIFIAYVLNRDFPPGLLQEMVELPWPLRGI